MPLLGLHMTVARELAAAIDSPLIDADRGAYYLGATTPDIRAMNHWDRERTHFFALDEFAPQDGVHRMLDEHAHLRDHAALGPETAAFMAGYISHLVLDENYIVDIYRPFFGRGSGRSDELLANVMDRLLLFHMDRDGRQDARALEDVQRSLAETAVNVAVDFISREDLVRWREVQLTVVLRPPSFAKMLTRQLSALGIEGEAAVSAYLEQHADMLLADTLRQIGEERIRVYLDEAKRRARRAMEEYLS